MAGRERRERSMPAGLQLAGRPRGAVSSAPSWRARRARRRGR